MKRIVIAVQRDADLVKVVLAAGFASRLTRSLNSGEQHAYQDSNNSDHNEQFDEREAGRCAARFG